MREYCFPYREEPSRAFVRIARPVVEIFLREQTGEWFKVFPKGLCKLLGLQLMAGQRSLIQGVGGKPIAVYLHRVQMRIGEKSFSSRVGFAASERMPYLLGRLDVLEHFHIRFEKDRVCFTEREG